MRVRGSGRHTTKGECPEALNLKRNQKRQHLRNRESVQKRLLKSRPVVRGHSPERKAAEKEAMKKKHRQIESMKVVGALSELRDILLYDEELERRAKLTLKLERKRKKLEREMHQKSEAAVRRREAFKAKKIADEDAAFFERQQNFKKRLASLAAYQAKEKALFEEKRARQRHLRQITFAEKKRKIALACEERLRETEKKVRGAEKKSKELLLDLHNRTQERIANKRRLRSCKSDKIRQLREKVYQDETDKIELSKEKFIRVSQRLGADFECRDRNHERHVDNKVAYRSKTYDYAMDYKRKVLEKKIRKMENADANSQLLLQTIHQQMTDEASEHKIMMKELKEHATAEKRSIEKNLKKYVEELLERVKKRNDQVDSMNSKKRAKSIEINQERTNDLNRKRRFIKTFEAVLANPFKAKPLLKMDIDLDDPEAHTKIDIGYILDVLEGEVEPPGKKVAKKKEPKFKTMQTQTSKQASSKPSRTVTARKPRNAISSSSSSTTKGKEQLTSPCPNRPPTVVKEVSKCFAPNCNIDSDFEDSSDSDSSDLRAQILMSPELKESGSEKIDSNSKIVEGYEGLDEATKTTLKKFEDQSSSESEEDPDMMLML